MNTLTHICESCSTALACIRGNLSRESKQDAAAICDDADSRASVVFRRGVAHTHCLKKKKKTK